MNSLLSPPVRRTLPWLVAALLCAAALVLTLHTAASRQERRRLEEERLKSGKSPVDAGMRTRYDPGRTSRPALTAEQRERAVAKRVREVLSIAYPLDRMRALLAVMEGFSSDDFRTALKTCDEFNGIEEGELNRTVLNEWMLHSPTEALTAQERGGMRRRDALQTLARLDGDAALKAVRSGSDAEMRGQNLTYILEILTGAHPEKTVELLGEIPQEDRLYAVWELSNLITSAKTVAELMRWAETQGDAEQRRQAILQVCRSPNLGMAAEQYALLLRHPELMSAEQTGSFLASWAGFDPAAAAEAVGQLPDGDLLQGALGRVVPQLIHSRRPELAEELMARHPERVDDPLRAAVAKAAVDQNPAGALARSEEITDAFLRDRTTAETLLQWQRNDPAAATAWMKDHEISASVRQKMEAAPRPPGS